MPSMPASLALLVALTVPAVSAGCAREVTSAPKPPAVQAPSSGAPAASDPGAALVPVLPAPAAERDANGGAARADDVAQPPAPRPSARPVPVDDPFTDPRPGAQAAADVLLERAKQRAEAEAGCDPLQKGSDCKPGVVEPVSPATVRGVVEPGALESLGGLGEFDDRLVAKELKKRHRAFQACYEWLLRQDPVLQGTVVVDFTLEPAGIISSSLLAAHSTGDPRLEPCAAGIIRRFRFNPGPDKGSVSYRSTLTFRPLQP